MGLLICLFGVDGSGKSTLARLVATYMHFQGHPIVILWMRGTHTIASLFARFFSKFKAFRGNCNIYYEICLPPKMKRVWGYIEFVSILPILLRFVVLKKLGRAVISERCPIDFIVWLILVLRNMGIIKSFLGKSVLSLTLSLCDYIIYIRADKKNLLERRKNFPEEHLLSLQLEIYDKIAELLCVPIVDTSDKMAIESFKEILYYIR